MAVKKLCIIYVVKYVVNKLNTKKKVLQFVKSFLLKQRL